MRPSYALTCLLPVCLILLSPGGAEAQPPAGRNGWSWGAAFGRSATGVDPDRASEDQGLDLRINIEAGLGSRWAARIEAGRVFGDAITRRRATIGLLRLSNSANAVRGYWGGGIALYHWKDNFGTIDASVTRGSFFTLGVTVPIGGRRWAVTTESQALLMGSPNRAGQHCADTLLGGCDRLSVTHSIGFRKLL